MSHIRARLLNLVHEPQRVPSAVVRRLFPNSPRFGFQWVKLPDGSVTFRERGFVAASSPSELLARHNYEVRRIHHELHDMHFSRSLEIGCGFGRLSITIAEHSDHHVAVDINDIALRTARSTYPSIDFRHGGTDALPFPDKTFGLVVTWTVLQHVRPERIDGACAEILRTLTPEATVLLCEETRNPHDTGGHTWHRRIEDYERLLAPLRLVSHGPIEEIAAMPGLESPGEVMIFRR